MESASGSKERPEDCGEFEDDSGKGRKRSLLSAKQKNRKRKKRETAAAGATASFSCMLDSGSSSDMPLYAIWLSQHLAPVVTCAAEVGLFERLAKSGRALSASQVAQECEITARGARVLLAAVESLGLVESEQESKSENIEGGVRIRRFEMTLRGRRFLTQDSPFHWLGPLHSTSGNTSHEKLLQILRKDSEDTPSASESWEGGQISAGQAYAVTQFMHRIGRATAPRLGKLIKKLGIFSPAPADKLNSNSSSSSSNQQTSKQIRLLDIGGGSGVFAAFIAEENPNVRAVVADLPEVCTALREGKYCPEDDRIETLSFDLFRDKWPLGFGAHLLSNILHDWDDARCRRILRKSFEAIEPGGVLLVNEMLLCKGRSSKTGDDSSSGGGFGLPVLQRSMRNVVSACFGVHMLMYTKGGRQLRFCELCEMLEDVGFEVSPESPVEVPGSWYSLTVARRPLLLL